MKKRNEEKAKILYDFLDQSEMFKGTVVKKDRSLMNVPFVTGDKDLDAKFVAEAKEAGFENLKGHRTVGVSIFQRPPTASSYVFPAERGLAAYVVTSNHGWFSNNEIKRCPTIPVAPKAPTEETVKKMEQIDGVVRVRVL